MEFNEQEYEFSFGDGEDNAAAQCLTRRDCRIILRALQSIFGHASERAREIIKKKLGAPLSGNDIGAFTGTIGTIWKYLRNETCFTMFLPTSVLDPLLKELQNGQSSDADNTDTAARLVLQINHGAEVFLKVRGSSTQVALQRTSYDIDLESDWHPWICASLTRILDNRTPESTRPIVIAWSPSVSEYRCTDLPAEQSVPQKANYRLKVREHCLTRPIVFHTQGHLFQISERAMFGERNQEMPGLIRALAGVIEQYCTDMKGSHLGAAYKQVIQGYRGSSVALPGAYYPLGVSPLPCIPGFNDLERIAHRVGDSYEENDAKTSAGNNSIKSVASYDMLRKTLNTIVGKIECKIERGWSVQGPGLKATVPDPSKGRPDTQTPEKSTQQGSEKPTSSRPSLPSKAIDDMQTPSKRPISGSLSQLKTLNLSYSLLDRPSKPGSIPESTFNKVLSTGRAQAQMEVAARTIYDPPDKTAEMAELMPSMYSADGTRKEAIERFLPSVQNVVEKRKAYFEAKIKEGICQPEAIAVWDKFHTKMMPPADFTGLLLDMADDLRLYAFHGIFRDIVYGMYLGMDTRGHVHLLCTSVQAYFSYDLYAEPSESLQRRNNIRDMLVNPVDAASAEGSRDTWVGHCQTLLREIFGLLRENTKSQIRKIISFENDLLRVIGSR